MSFPVMPPSSEQCQVCRMNGIMICSHRNSDLNRTGTTFSGSPNGLREFQFFGHGDGDVDDDTVAWLVDDDAKAAGEERSPLVEPPFKYLDCLRISSGDHPRRPAFDSCSSTSGSTPRSPSWAEFSITGQAASAGTTISFCGGAAASTGASSSSSSMKVVEADQKAAASGKDDTAMEREARVLRYKEKKKKRKFEKQIRYASRKAYAETRPRIKGRFAKIPEASQQPLISVPPHHHQHNTDQLGLDMGWFHP